MDMPKKIIYIQYHGGKAELYLPEALLYVPLDSVRKWFDLLWRNADLRDNKSTIEEIE